MEETIPQKALRALTEFGHLSHPHARAAAVGVGKNAVISMAASLRRDPRIADRIRAGEFTTMAQVGRAVGLPSYVNRPDARLDGAQGIFFGKGDKFNEAFLPVRRYLGGWERRGYELRHVAPAEATRRIEIIDLTIESLQEMRAELVKRSHRATLTGGK